MAIKAIRLYSSGTQAHRWLARMHSVVRVTLTCDYLRASAAGLNTSLRPRQLLSYVQPLSYVHRASATSITLAHVQHRSSTSSVAVHVDAAHA